MSFADDFLNSHITAGEAKELTNSTQHDDHDTQEYSRALIDEDDPGRESGVVDLEVGYEEGKSTTPKTRRTVIPSTPWRTETTARKRRH